ncbi:hypothetical protein EZS27_029151, partial [termite gut metagenome]
KLKDRITNSNIAVTDELTKAIDRLDGLLKHANETALNEPGYDMPKLKAALKDVSSQKVDVELLVSSIEKKQEAPNAAPEVEEADRIEDERKREEGTKIRKILDNVNDELAKEPFKSRFANIKTALEGFSEKGRATVSTVYNDIVGFKAELRDAVKRNVLSDIEAASTNLKIAINTFNKYYETAVNNAEKEKADEAARNNPPQHHDKAPEVKPKPEPVPVTISEPKAVSKKVKVEAIEFVAKLKEFFFQVKDQFMPTDQNDLIDFISTPFYGKITWLSDIITKDANGTEPTIGQRVSVNNFITAFTEFINEGGLFTDTQNGKTYTIEEFFKSSNGRVFFTKSAQQQQEEHNNAVANTSVGTAEAVSETPASDEPAPKPAGSEFGANNTVITKDRFEELKRQAKAKMGNLNVGIDPELMTITAQMMMYYIEGGIRKFADISSAMISDLGEGIKPYLKGTYEYARMMPGMEPFISEMDTHDYVVQYSDEILTPEGNDNQEEVDEIIDETKEEQAATVIKSVRNAIDRLAEWYSILDDKMKKELEEEYYDVVNNAEEFYSFIENNDVSTELGGHDYIIEHASIQISNLLRFQSEMNQKRLDLEEARRLAVLPEPSPIVNNNAKEIIGKIKYGERQVRNSMYKGERDDIIAWLGTKDVGDIIDITQYFIDVAYDIDKYIKDLDADISSNFNDRYNVGSVYAYAEEYINKLDAINKGYLASKADEEAESLSRARADSAIEILADLIPAINNIVNTQPEDKLYYEDEDYLSNINKEYRHSVTIEQVDTHTQLQFVDGSNELSKTDINKIIAYSEKVYNLHNRIAQHINSGNLSVGDRKELSARLRLIHEEIPKFKEDLLKSKEYAKFTTEQLRASMGKLNALVDTVNEAAKAFEIIEN